MRTNKLALAAALAAAALSANAAGVRTESATSPFTYEVLGATPTLTFGRAQAAPPKAATVKADEASKPAAAAVTSTAAPRTAGATATPFTYDTLGATPHVEAKKASRTETMTSQPAR